MDLLVGLAWLVAAAALTRTRRDALLAAGVGSSWLAGSLVGDLALLHRGPLAHMLLAYPAGRVPSTPVRLAILAGYLSALAPGSTLVFALGLAGAVTLRWAGATGIIRRARLVPTVAGVLIGGVLAFGAIAGEPVLVAYEAVLALTALALCADLRAARWGLIDLAVDLGRRPVGGAIRERLARAVGDPSLEVAYVVDGARVDELGAPVELPLDRARVVTPVGPPSEPVALLIHDPAVPVGSLDAAASVLGVAVANARLQVEVRARMDEVAASTTRLLDAADAERRRLGADLRAEIDPLLAGAADDLSAAEAPAALLERLSGARAGLFQLAAGLDPAAGGLELALRELAANSGIPASVSVPAERFAPALESCVWFTCAEATANALKHARASRLDISVRRLGPTLRVEVADDGIGGASAGTGSGLRRLGERVDSAGGRLEIDSARGAGTRIVAELDLRRAGS